MKDKINKFLEVEDRVFRAPYNFLKEKGIIDKVKEIKTCLLYTSPSPRDGLLSRMPSSA